MNFDLLVIGAGSGGLAAAKRSASHGAKVAIVEGDRVGGTCVIRGCVPKKLLVYGSEYKELILNAKSYGWDLGPTRCNTTTLLTNVRKEVDRLNQLHINLLEKAEVELINGWAKFADSNTIQIGNRFETAKNILIAVGGKPNRLKIPGGELGLVSDDIFELEKFPSSITIIGAGYIACEFACILAGLGVDVTQLVRGSRILKGFDSESVQAIEAEMIEMGIKIEFQSKPISITQDDGGLTISYTQIFDEKPVQKCLKTDNLLQATGRQARIKCLDLGAAAIEHKSDRIIVDEYQQTNIKHIFAIGDVTNRVNLTPVAVDEGRAVADHLFAGKNRIVNHQLIATAVFTQPEFASVGLSEDQAIINYGVNGLKIYRAKFRSLQQALPARGARCFLKLVAEKESDRILGCHMVGSHAAEIIQMAAIAVGMGATKADFDQTMALHPSISEEFVTMV